MDHRDHRNSWRMFSCACGGGAAAEKRVINPFLQMQRFRPIAPKPVSADESGSRSGFLGPYKPRSKRKYVRVCKNNKKRKRKISSSQEEERNGCVTLQLLPENTELDPAEINLNHPVEPSIVSELEENNFADYQTQMSSHSRLIEKRHLDLMVKVKREVVESLVTVECVTDNTCMEMGASLGRSTDIMSVKVDLEVDTCPGFITDGCYRVEWINTAYKRMMKVAGVEDGGEILPEIRVGLAVKDDLVLPWLNAAFTCRVRVQYTWRKEKWSKTVPCDVWRVDRGAFAWRLDVEAALSLGR